MMCRAVLALPALLTLLVPVPDTEPRDDMLRAQGKWEIVFMQENGKVLPADEAKLIEVVVSKDRITWSTGDDVFAEYRFTFDAEKRPKQSNFVGLSPDIRGKVMPGIYAFEDGMLKVVVNVEGNERPRSFDANESRRFNIVHLRRKGN